MNHNHVMVIAGLLFLLIVSSGCTMQPGEVPVTPTPAATTIPTTEIQPMPKDSLTGTEWHLISFNNGRVSALNVLPGTKISAVFDPTGHLTGSGGCNNYSATYEAGLKGALSITVPEVTSRKCVDPPGVMTQETQYLAMLGGVDAFEVRGNLLLLLDYSGNTLATFSNT